MNDNKRKVDNLNTDATEVPPTKIVLPTTTIFSKFAIRKDNSRTYDKVPRRVPKKGVANSNQNAIDPMFKNQEFKATSTSDVEPRFGFVSAAELGRDGYTVSTFGYGARNEPSGVTTDNLAIADTKALKGPNQTYREFDLTLEVTADGGTSKSISESECDLSYTWEKNEGDTILYINRIDCEKKNGIKGRGKRHVLNTIRALRENDKKFNRIKLMPVDGSDPDRRNNPENLVKLVRNYRTWGFDDLIGDTLEADREHIETTIARSLGVQGGSKNKTKKTKKRRQKKTKRKQKGNKRRQTKKRGKR
jgi:hypothetical protein